MKNNIRSGIFLQLVSSALIFISLSACAAAEKQKPTALSETQMVRIREAYSKLQEYFNEWQLKEHGQDCLLLFNDREEWLVGCNGFEMPEFQPTGQRFLDANVLWLNKSFYVSGKLIPYENVKMNLVGTVGSYKASDGVDRPVLILQEWDVLRAHHPGFLDSPLEEWLAVFVHEAFHARQMWHPAVQKKLQTWVQSPVVSAQDLMTFYKQNSGFQAHIKKEYLLLSGATDRPDLTATEARSVLKKWFALYQARQKMFSGEMEKAFPGRKAWEMDGFYTFIEGTARYVEAQYLMAGVPGYPELVSDATFKNFASSRGKKPSQLAGLGNIGSKYFYSLGMHLSFLLDRARPDWKKGVFTNGDFLLGEIKKAIR